MEIKEDVFDIMYEPLAGSSMKNFLHLLTQNRFRITPRYLPRTLYASLMISIISPFRVKEYLKYGKKIKETEIKEDPVFIIGHWRSGTTYVHNILAEDPHFGWCSTFQATLPGVFLGSEKLLKPVVAASIPNKRPMDNALMGADLPQEEEYAIANITPLGYYNGWCFPHNMGLYNRFVGFTDCPTELKKTWMKTYHDFIKKLTLKQNGKQLLLKNPANTARIPLLKKLFPDAKFIHIYRNPYDVFSSMKKFMRIVLPRYCLQRPPPMNQIEQMILENYRSLHECYLQDKHLLSKNELFEMKYEDFITDPLPFLKDIYENFHIERYSQVQSRFKAYVDAQKSFRTDSYHLTNLQKERIYKEAREIFNAYEYDV